MKAWRVPHHGGTAPADGALTRVDLPTPEPGPMQARVRVEAVGLNHLDLWVRKGVAGHKFPLPLIPGCDVAGVVDAFGPGAADAAPELALGAPIVVNPGISCGRCEACLGGFDPLCAKYGILGETRDGGCADYAVVPVQNLVARPAGLSATDAAALPIPFLTAWTMLTRKAQLRAGETVLIQAGGSGVSVAAIQMAKLLGAQVITTVGSADKATKARALGADHVILYRDQNVRDEVRKIVGKRGCEVVIDHVGADTWAESMKCLSWGGRIACCGATSGSGIQIDLKAVFFKNLSIFGTTMGSKADFLRILALVGQGRLEAVVDSVLPMADLPRAHDRLESRAAFGKVIVVN